jgi:hypothetical protein
MALLGALVARVRAVDEDGRAFELAEHRVAVLLRTDVEEMDSNRLRGPRGIASLHACS